MFHALGEHLRAAAPAADHRNPHDEISAFAAAARHRRRDKRHRARPIGGARHRRGQRAIAKAARSVVCIGVSFEVCGVVPSSERGMSPVGGAMPERAVKDYGE